MARPAARPHGRAGHPRARRASVIAGANFAQGMAAARKRGLRGGPEGLPQRESHRGSGQQGGGEARRTGWAE